MRGLEKFLNRFRHLQCRVCNFTYAFRNWAFIKSSLWSCRVCASVKTSEQQNKEFPVTAICLWLTQANSAKFLTAVNSKTNSV